MWMSGENQHNSGARSSGGRFKLFGVQIDVAAAANGGGDSTTIMRSESLGNLKSRDSENAAVDPPGYLSDGLVHRSSKSHERKKGRPWTEEEHRSFLVGLKTLGKGDWKRIASNYVPTRSSSQVASHAQKYFIRMAATEKKKRRNSVFDIPLNDHTSSSSSVPVTTGEMPPLSTMTRYSSVPNFRHLLYSRRAQEFRQEFRPTAAWVPLVTYASCASTSDPMQKGRGVGGASHSNEPSLNISNLRL